MKRNERVKTIMTTEPDTVHIKQSVLDVQKMMFEHKYHHVPVVSGKKLVGMISMSDLNRASYSYGVDGRAADAVLDHTQTIESVMQKGVVTVTPDDTIRHATEILVKDWFHSLAVTNDKDELVGIITTTDVLNHLLDQY